MNNHEDMSGIRESRIDKRVLELTSQGCNTRKAKRQAEREARIYWNKVDKRSIRK